MSGCLWFLFDRRYNVASCLNCVDNYSTIQICDNVSNLGKIYRLGLKYLQWQLIKDTAYFKYSKYVDKSVF